jgi:hypothetical protein
MSCKIPEGESTKWVVLVGMVVAIVGVLAEARVCDVREGEVLGELARSEARAARAEDQLLVARLRSAADVAELRRRLVASQAEALVCRARYDAAVVDELRKLLKHVK